MPSPIGHEALIPNQRLAAFSRFVGVWKTTGRHAMMPGVELHGRTAFEWHENGAYVCVRSEIDEPKIPSGIALIGSDDHSDGYTMLYFDERNVSRQFDVTVAGDVLTWQRLVTGFSQRCVLTVSGDGRTMHAESSLCQDGVHWETDLTLEYSRID